MNRLLLFLLLLWSGSAPAQFVIPITVSDGAPLSRNLGIGLLPDGHFCLSAADSFGGFVEYEIPPPPPFQTLGTRLVNPRRPVSVTDDCFGFGSFTDFRPVAADGQRDTFYVNADYGGVVMVQWGTGLSLYLSELRLVDTVSNGGVFSIDMLSTQSVTLPGGHRQFKILMRTPYTPAALFAAQPPSLDFGSIPRTALRTDTVRISNPGELHLSVSGITIAGSTAFTVAPTGPLTIPPMESRRFTVTFDPPEAGVYEGAMVVHSNSSTAPDSIPLAGTALSPVASLYPAAVAFDTLPAFLGQAVEHVRVLNNGAVPLTIAGVSASGPPFGATVAPSTLAPGDSVMLEVTFEPEEPGDAAGWCVLTHNGDTSPDTVVLTGAAVMPEPLRFLTLPPETLLAEEFGKPGKFLKPAKRGKGGAPNWANLRDETIAQGGFRPGTSESDSAGGIRLGISFMERRNPGDPAKPNWKPRKDAAAAFCWVRIGKWNFKKTVGASPESIPKTLRSRGLLTHEGPPRGLDSTGQPGSPPRKSLHGELKKLEPKKSSNALFAELLALKLSIAVSALGKSPAGFGELVFRREGNFLDGRTVAGIARCGDSLLTFWQGRTGEQYDSLHGAIRDINRAFAGALDTLGNWETPEPGFPQGTLRVKGTSDVFTIPFLRVPVVFRPVLLAASSGAVEPEHDPDTEDGDEEDGPLPAALQVHQNYPNPFNPATVIGVVLAEPARVSVRVYSVLGQEVTVLAAEEELDEGYTGYTFDGTGLASGLYICRVEAVVPGSGSAGAVATVKMLLLK